MKTRNFNSRSLNKSYNMQITLTGNIRPLNKSGLCGLSKSKNYLIIFKFKMKL